MGFGFDTGKVVFLPRSAESSPWRKRATGGQVPQGSRSDPQGLTLRVLADWRAMNGRERAKWYGEGVPVAQNRRAGRPSNGKAVVMLDFGFALKNGDCVGSGQHWRRENLSPNGTLGT